MDDICVRVKLIRGSHKMTQKEFASRLGVTNAHISRIEKGLTKPSTALVKLICQTYNINELWLSSGKEPMWKEDLMIQEDAISQHNTSFLNALLKTDGIVRSLTLEIETMCVKIITPPNADELEVADYLTRCYNLFSHIQDFLAWRKLTASNQQTQFGVTLDDTIKLLAADLTAIEKVIEKETQQ